MPLGEGIVLPGITRQSILEVSKEWGDFKVTEKTLTMADLTKAINEDRVSWTTDRLIIATEKDFFTKSAMVRERLSMN